MTFPPIGLAILIGVASVQAIGVSAAGQDSFARARELYVLAAYDEALVVLDRIHGTASADEAADIAGYQVFCLLALGRTDEARQAIATLVESNPHYRPSEAIASPRTRALFDEVRLGLLPDVAQNLYDEAKAALDQDQPKKAASEFDRVLALLNEPGVSGQPGMSDLRRLATGFRELSLARVAAAGEPPPAIPTDPVPPLPPATYSAEDADVVPPASVSRDLPPWQPRSPLHARREHQGLVVVVVDEKGDVVSAQLSKSVHPDYDKALLEAARTWKFQPATRDGKPVRYRSLFVVRLRPSGTEAPSAPR